MRTVRGLWVGDSLTAVEKLSIKSFIANGHPYELFAYGPISGVPEGVRLRDANEIARADEIYRDRKGRLSAFSDLFRWRMLRQYGGVWADLDVICLRPFDFAGDRFLGVERSDGQLGTAVIGATPGDALTIMLSRACDDVNAFQPTDGLKAVVKKTLRSALLSAEASRVHTRFSEPGGPAYATRTIRYYGLYEEIARPQEWFYPIGYHEWRLCFDRADLARSRLEGSYAVHLWNNILISDKAFNKHDIDLNGTLFGELCLRYGIDT